MTMIDPRLKAALSDAGQALGMLNGLHQRIVSCRDSRALSELLGEYAAVAAARAKQLDPLAGALQVENRKFTTLSNIMKTKHDVAMSVIKNMKA